MIRIQHFLNFGILLGFVACANPSQTQYAAASLAPDFLSSEERDLDQQRGIPVSVNIDGRLELQFQVADLWTDAAYLQQIHHDTVYLMLGLVEKISGHHFNINLQDQNIKSVSVFQRYETSLTLMDEGPHVDLTDWVHYTSDWEELSVHDDQFSSAVYETYHYQQFPEVSNEEIIQAVAARVNSSERWLALAQKCDNPQSYPCGVSISRYFLKLSITDQHDLTTESVVVFEVPMGC